MSLDILQEIEYPESDGEPMGESDLHRWWMIRIYDLLSHRYRGQRVYIGSDLLLYYTEGIPRDFVVPDDFIVLDCEPGMRRTFKTWEEGRVPNVVFEVTSRYTKKKDQVFKPLTYAQIGVKELFLFDPTGDYLRPRLAGFRLVGGTLKPIAGNPEKGLRCRELGLMLRLEKKKLLMLDAANGAVLLTEAEAERAAREKAEEVIRRLKAELSRRPTGGP
jgi:Uma2 family endonuclease